MYPASTPTGFLSTLSLRRATGHRTNGNSSDTYFYPRSPCGERLATALNQYLKEQISIHALLAESDHGFLRGLPKEHLFLSTLSLRRATNGLEIIANNITYFYPRSPCGERRGLGRQGWDLLRFLSTLSLRRATRILIFPGRIGFLFLSTLSLRRAT